jgi:hypothetical protein
MRLPIADIAVPIQAGAVVAGETREFTNKGEWLDSAVVYASPDKQMHATVYVYYPALAHTGLTAIATDFFVRPQSASSSGAETVAAGGQDGVAIRQAYTRYRGGLASEAAYLRAGEWIVKLRVSGPQDRSAEVAATMKTLLDGLVFGKDAAPRPALPIRLVECQAASAAKPARVLGGGDEAKVMPDLVAALLDGGGNAATDERGKASVLPSRIPERLCQPEVLTIGDSRIALLRAPARAKGAVDGSASLIAILSDGGGFLEILEMPKQKAHVVFHHEVGKTTMLGRFDAAPSSAQVASLLQGHDSSRVRAEIRRRPGEGDEIEIRADVPTT